MTAEHDVKAFYDQVWQSYGQLDAVSPAAFHRRRLVVELARRYTRVLPSILDVGCGQGELLRELEIALPRARVHGADISVQSLLDSRKRNPTYTLFEMDLVQPTFDATYEKHLGAYDLVVCCEVVEHIPRDAEALRNLAQLVAPGGTLIMTVPGGKMSRFDEIIGHQRHYRPEMLRKLLEDAALDVTEVFAWGFPFHSLYRTAVRIASRTALKPNPQERSGDMHGVLGAGYTFFGKALKPLFYLNTRFWGEQIIAVATRRSS